MLIPPDLTAEIFGEQERAKVERKLQLDIENGVRLALMVDPQEESITVYSRSHAPFTLRKGNTLAGGDAIPGLMLPLTDFFDRTL